MLELGFKLRLDSAFTTMVGHLFLDINEEKDKEQPQAISSIREVCCNRKSDLELPWRPKKK